MFILIRLTQHVSGHHYAHHQENRLCKQLVGIPTLVYQLSHSFTQCTTAANTTRHTPHAVFYIVCSPDDGHNDARNMLS